MCIRDRHWEARLEVMDGKAMIVCMSRRICFEVYEAIRKLRPKWHHKDDARGVMKIAVSYTHLYTLMTPIYRLFFRRTSRQLMIGSVSINGSAKPPRSLSRCSNPD